MSIDAMKQALEALEHEAKVQNDDAYKYEREALRAAIEQAPYMTYSNIKVDPVTGDVGIGTPEQIHTSADSNTHQPELNTHQCEQEPVAWAVEFPDGTRRPLYTHPPEFTCSTWLCHYRKPLTDEEIDQVTDAQWASNNHKPIYAAHRAYARAIEAAHGIGKNK